MCKLSAPDSCALRVATGLLLRPFRRPSRLQRQATLFVQGSAFHACVKLRA